ncbi:MAG TPA: proprotein convertase P-domain-containing protein [Gammaproteobacteria bacterium]|nr:proprotein convertase P-domain-containing protein [Xanthomonadales bacterium]MCB1594423.1 proprotein convertase P-domain-containing protein [Xanthomonadales bacterium]HOP23504.1 proprotein convertase P-domain-containing protein [Gammaproteobacteria bacterium]HPI96564.1 proprotein convertase P-domain-containing protein [Gammaproteobacteria bacterium]HPQ87987.1 proprotein convertase P-domain-containing protein [Gammaproteobacteria bacterium]
MKSKHIVGIAVFLIFSANVSALNKEENAQRLNQIDAEINAAKASGNTSEVDALLNEYQSISTSLGGDVTVSNAGGIANPNYNSVRSVPPVPLYTNLTTTNFSDTPNLAIPDNGSTQTGINVSVADTYLWDLDVSLEITHTWSADLDITLTSPSGTVITLTTDNGGGNDNVFNGTLFDDDAVDVDPANTVTDFAYTNLVTATPLVPEEALAAFIGEDPNGTWLLDIADDTGADTGILINWSLDISTLDGDLVNDSVVTNTSNPAAAINDNTLLQDTIAVNTVNTVICDLSVETSITHTWSADLEISLISPSGTEVRITTDNGAGNDNVFNGTVWDDNADTPVTDATYSNGVTATPLVPEAAFGAFIGENPNGNWTLNIFDDANGDTGNLASWTLDITTCKGLSAVAGSSVANGNLMDFGNNPTFSFNMTNDMTANQDLANIQCSFSGGDAGQFSVTTAMPAGPVAPGGATVIDLAVSAVPINTTYSSTLNCSFDNDFDDSSFSWPVSASGLDSAIAGSNPVSGTPINMSFNSPSFSIIMSNDASALLDLSNIQCGFTGGNASEFSVISAMPAGPLAPGSQTTLDFMSNIPPSNTTWNTTLVCTFDNDVTVASFDWPVGISGPIVIPTINNYGLIILLFLIGIFGFVFISRLKTE